MPQVRTNKRILVFADESVVANERMAVGVLVVAAKDLSRMESEVLGSLGVGRSLGELHGSGNSVVLTKSVLEGLAAGNAGAKTARVLAAVPLSGGPAAAYFAALEKGVVTALKVYKRRVLRSDVINNADLYVDEIAMAGHIDVATEFERLQASRVGSFKAIRKAVSIDSTISRSLQFADAIAYSAQPRFGASPADFERWGIARV